MIIENEQLARYTSWKIGGPARFFADATAPQQVTDLLGWAHGHDVPVFILGGGTNLLVQDNGFNGLVLRYRSQGVRIEEREGTIYAVIAAGAPTAGTVRRLAKQGYGGLEWAEGLPGTIGGAVYGNAGCYGSDIASTLVRGWVLVDGEVEEWPVERFGYGYRTSALKRMAAGHHPTTAHHTEEADVARASVLRSRTSVPDRPIVLTAEFALTQVDPSELAAKMEQTATARRSKTPSGQSCGSVFKNPPGDSSGRLIEAAGLKGTRIGAAEIAEKHANYIVNLGGATSADVLGLIDLARERVFKQFGVTLELEVQLVG